MSAGATPTVRQQPHILTEVRLIGFGLVLLGPVVGVTLWQGWLPGWAIALHIAVAVVSTLLTIAPMPFVQRRRAKWLRWSFPGLWLVLVLAVCSQVGGTGMELLSTLVVVDLLDYVRRAWFET